MTYEEAVEDAENAYFAEVGAAEHLLHLAEQAFDNSMLAAELARANSRDLYQTRTGREYHAEF